jgi:hypothetical protein
VARRLAPLIMCYGFRGWVWLFRKTPDGHPTAASARPADNHQPRGCASSGRGIDNAAIDRFLIDQTTEREVIATLGPPTGRFSDTSFGLHGIAYNYLHIHTRAATFIPVVGLFAGGTDATMQSASFSFSADGVLRHFGHNDTNVGTSTGPL